MICNLRRGCGWRGSRGRCGVELRASSLLQGQFVGAGGFGFGFGHLRLHLAAAGARRRLDTGCGRCAGKAVAESVDPTVEHAYWKEAHARRPYYVEGYTYDDYGPAYEIGLRDVHKYKGRPYEDVQETLAADWDMYRGKSRLTWPEATPAARDAWERAQHLNMSQ